MDWEQAETNVKPLIRVNSCLISPPSDLALSLAFVSSSGEAFSFRVTLIGISGWMTWQGSRAYIVERHVDDTN